MSELNNELELSFKLDVKDLVELRMYRSSQNKKINRQRTITRFAVLLICVLIAAIYEYKGNRISSAYFLLMGTICFILFPLYLNWLYRRTYRKQINLSGFPIPVWLKIDEAHIVTLAKGVTSTIPLSEINEIVELDDYFYLKRTLTDLIIIPKSELTNEDEVMAFLASVALVNNIRYSEEKGFKWK